MHLYGAHADFLAQLRRKRHSQTAARLAVKERAIRHLAAEHLLQTHGLRAQLQFIAAILLRRTVQPYFRILVRRKPTTHTTT